MPSLDRGQLQVLGAAAGVNLPASSLSAINGSGLAVPASDTAGLSGIAHVERGLDNTTGADGDAKSRDRTIVVKRNCIAGPYALHSGSGTPIAGATAYVANSREVSTDTGTNSIEAGEFWQPEELGAGWFIRIS